MWHIFFFNSSHVISATTIFFFPSIFCIATNFFFPISVMTLPQLVSRSVGISVMPLPKFNKSRREKEKKWEREIFYFRQHHHRNSFCPYLLSEWVLEVWVCARKTKCGNGIAEIGKKNLAIVAMPLPKIGGKKNSGCRNHMWGIKKKCATFTIFL